MAEYKVVDAEKLDADLASVAEAIRTKGNTTEDLTFPQGFVDAVGAIESGGGTEEIENLIDQSGVLESIDGTVTEKVEGLIDKAEYENNLYEASKLWTTQFAGLLNTNTNVKKCPRFSFEKATSLRWFAPYSTIETIDYYINSPNITTIEQGFRDCKNLYFMYGVDLSNTVNAKELFYNCENLETIQEPLDFSKITLNTNIFMFYHCYKLKNIKFVENSIKKTIQNGFVDSPLLTAESIQSIIDGLATVETAQTLALHADVKAKLTTEQLATITSKNWNLA